jgi:glycosyltransferase involved in cell wall biosynthesis
MGRLLSKKQEKPNQKVQVLLISQYYPPDVGGASTRALNLTKALVSKGYNVAVITTVPHYPDGNKMGMPKRRLFNWTYQPNIRILRFWMPSISHNNNAGRLINYIFFTLVSIIGIFLTPRPRVVFAQSPNFFSWISGVFGKLFWGVPLIVNIDDLWPEAIIDLGVTKSTLLASTITALRGVCFHLSDAVVCISRGIAEVLHRLTIMRGKVFVVEVGYDFHDIYHQNQILTKPSKLISKIVYSGIFGPAYDFNLLIILAEEFQKSNLDYSISVKGRGPEFLRIQNIINRKRIQKMNLLNYWMSEVDHKSFMKQADVFILPMRDNFISTTALPTKLIEYMAYGKPVVVVGTGETARIVREAGCGFSTTWGEIGKIIEFLNDIRQKPEKYASLGKAGYSYAKMHFSIEAIGEKLDRVIQRIC